MPATYLFRGLCRLLPLPCANNTTPIARSGTTRSPSNPSGGISTDCSLVAMLMIASRDALTGTPLEQFPDLCIRNLRKIFVARADRIKRLGCCCAHDLVDVPAEIFARFPGSDGNSHHNLLGPPLPQRTCRRQHGGARCEAVIHYDHHTLFNGQRWPALAVKNLTAFDLALLAGGYVVNDGRRDLELFDYGMIQHPDASTGESAHGQFFVPWDAQLAHDEYIQIGMERMGDFESYGHTAARQRKHDHIRIRDKSF